ncbi:MAG TPA: hypothetical protein VHA11_08280, partial [Bryobacteraceae bacterium]|nr:hypothetical protein [Bryobacteraceae bacterium]
VAGNQDRAEHLRSSFVYQQNLLMRLRRANHKLAREERSEFTVTPGPAGVEKKLAHFSGRYERDGTFISYDHPNYHYKDTDIDGDLISDLGNGLTNDSSRDGIAGDLFPLTAAQQAKYTFRLLGRETRRGRDLFRIAFGPRRGVENANWSGEALIDAVEYQPVRVSTSLARGVPFWIRTALGTNLKYLGFSLGYERFEDGVWFPVSYGGEFEVKLLFFYKRLITVSLENKGFQRTQADSTITYEQAEK